MAVVWIILSVLLWGVSFLMLFRRITLAPAISYMALFILSMAEENSLPLLPINNVILISWLSITAVATVATMLQPEAVRSTRHGMGYMVLGAFAGMAAGLLGFTITDDMPMRYSIMATATVAGTFFGYLLFSNTPHGRAANTGFFSYLTAKGFPVAITMMQSGVALVLAIALYQV